MGGRVGCGDTVSIRIMKITLIASNSKNHAMLVLTTTTTVVLILLLIIFVLKCGASSRVSVLFLTVFGLVRAMGLL